MKDRIKLSEEASYQLDVIKKRLRMGGQDDFIPIRIAFGRSLQVKGEPEISEPIEGKAKRKELQLTTFEQQQGLLFQALLSQRYKRKIEGDEYVDLLTKHIEHGLWTIATDTEKISGYDYLVALTSGKKLKDGVASTTKVNNPFPQNASVLNLHIGRIKETKQSVDYSINLANNPHVAIMGGSGSGKTYFLKHFLNEIRSKSKQETHFVIFDYKDGDIAKDKKFASSTQAEVINVKKRPLPLNIFAGVGDDDKEQKLRAERVVEIVKNVEANIGKVQENNLYNAILNAYQLHSGLGGLTEILEEENIKTNLSGQNSYPDFSNVREELEKINQKPDSLTSVLRPLVDLNYFAERHEPVYHDWVNRTTIIDIHDIERKELVVFFVLNQIHHELKQLGPVPLDSKTGARQIRIVIVIDEAHYFLENTKRAKILAKMIRDVRSAGGAVVLASQSPDDYDKDDFDYLELMEYVVALKSTPKSHKFLQQKFSLSANDAKELLKKIGKIEQGEGYCFVNKKVELVELCK